jgi:hypothetical protein
MTARRAARYLGRALLVAACPLAVAGARAGAQAPAGPAAAVPAVPDSATPVVGRGIAGHWLMNGYKGSNDFADRERVILSADGSPPPLLPWARKLLNERLADSGRGTPFANTLSRCLPGGLPQMLFTGGEGFMIVEAPDRIVFLFHEQNNFRVVRLDQPHVKEPDPNYMGDSVGHWDGDTLVIDTIGLNDKTTLDQVGTPHSENLHLVERYRRTGAGSLELVLTLEDPAAFSQPWQARATYRAAPAGMLLDEYICENNRNAPDVSGYQGLQGALVPPGKP